MNMMSNHFMMFWWGLRARTIYVDELIPLRSLNNYVDSFMKDKLLFIPFVIFKKCCIPFKVDLLWLIVKKFLCWENGVLHGKQAKVVQSI